MSARPGLQEEHFFGKKPSLSNAASISLLEGSLDL
jgi:hypothetical protein